MTHLAFVALSAQICAAHVLRVKEARLFRRTAWILNVLNSCVCLFLVLLFCSHFRAKVKSVTFLLPVEDIYTNRPVLAHHAPDRNSRDLSAIVETDSWGRRRPWFWEKDPDGGKWIKQCGPGCRFIRWRFVFSGQPDVWFVTPDLQAWAPVTDLVSPNSSERSDLILSSLLPVHHISQLWLLPVPFPQIPSYNKTSLLLQHQIPFLNPQSRSSLVPAPEMGLFRWLKK